MYYQIQIRRGTASEWTATNPILAAGELAVESDTNKMKVGNGSTAWNSLAYATATPTQLNLKADLASPTFTGNVVLPSTTSIGTVSATEIGYVDGVTSAIQTQLDSKLTAATAYTSGRNVLINGDFKVWQRGTAVQFNIGQGAYAADRWCGSHQYQNSRTQRTSISSPPSGLLAQYALRSSSSTTAQQSIGTRMRIAQKVESANSYRLRGQQVTLSFWIRFSAATLSSVANSTNSDYFNFNYSIGSYTSTTDATTNTSAADVSSLGTINNGSLPTTWTKYTITGTISSTANNVDVVFGFSGLGSTAAADTAWFEFAQVQLEVGAVATPFEFEDYETTLAKCQRYYQRRSGEKNYGLLTAQTGSNLYGIIPLPVSMRVAPTSVDAGSLRAFDLFNAAQVFYTFGLDGTASTENMAAIAATATGFTSFRTYYIIHNGSTSYLGFSAEL